MKANLQQLKRLVLELALLITIARLPSDASCVPGRYYCGTQVTHRVRQSTRAQNTTIYLCDIDGESFVTSHSCHDGCKVVANGDAICLCKPNKQYCGHEMKEFRIDHQYDGQSLYACDESGANVSLIEMCQLGCKDGQPSLCYQTCSEGKFYCGNHLRELGWQGDDISTDILYQCVAGGMNISIWTPCSEGCVTNRCKCRRGETYCGRELYQQLGWTNMKERPAYLFQCAMNGSTASEKFDCYSCIGKNTTALCESNSNTSILDPECQPSRCDCSADYHYCGHELIERGWQGYDNHTMYQCHGGDKVVKLKTCRGTCLEASSTLNSFCAKECVQGNHCGHKLNELGFDGYNNDTIYSCDANGQNITIWANCTPGTCDSRYCKCDPGQYYCGHELYSDMGWTNVKDRPHELQKCMPDGTARTLHSTVACPKCIDAHQRLSCQCEPGTPCSSECRPWTNTSWCECILNAYYCGYELPQLGWHGYENNTVYQCHGGNNVAVVQACKVDCIRLATTPYRACGRECDPSSNYCGRKLKELGWEEYDDDSTLYRCNIDRTTVSKVTNCSRGCDGYGCKCEPGRYYCNHELYSDLGWSNFKGRPHELRLCLPSGEDTRMDNGLLCPACIGTLQRSTCQCEPGAQCSSDCQPRTNTSWCECVPNAKYCGYELPQTGWHGYENNTVYQCHGGNNVAVVQACSQNCIKRKTSPYRACGGECIAGKKYCGSLLHRMGYEGYISESLYLCTDANSPLIDTGETNIHQCRKQCTPRRNYCGYEIQYAHDVASDAHHERFVCQEDGSFRSVAVCSTCMNDGSGAYCSCIPGWRYCGRVIYTTGWQGFTETYLLPLLYTNDTIFRCKEENAVEYVETCPHGECKNDYRDAHCLCTANRTYCGHELYEHYNSNDAYLYPHYIYRCSKTRQSVIEEQRCVNCFRIDGAPKCRQECVVGSFYCGSDLLLLEGWQNQDVDVNSLYKCDNSTTAQQIGKCSAGCISSSADPTHDAYCATPTTPWYWFLIGIGVPFVVLSLGLVLARIGLNHRRLKRRIEAQRIDANQLVTAREPLGKGEFGVVLRATYKPKEGGGNSVEVAIKITLGKMDDSSKLACANCFLQEVIALDILKHQNIIKAFGICTNYKDQMGNTVPALVLEYMNGGSAISYLRSERHRLTACDLLQILTDISQGGDHLCKMGIIHRDIGARNVLVQKDPNTGRAKLAKLTDFGLAKDIGKLTSIYKSTHPERAIFHCRYTAPECFRGEFSSKSDVWSFAVLIWELYTVLDEDPTAAVSKPPPMPYSEIYDNTEVMEEVLGGLKLQQPKTAPDDIYRLMLRSWTKAPEARPSFKELARFFSSKQGANEAQLIVPLPSAASLEQSSDEQLQSAETPMHEGDGQQIEGYCRSR